MIRRDDMTNIEKIAADGKLGVFVAMRKGDNDVFCKRFNIPMRPDTSYDLEKWMFDEYVGPDEEDK